MVKTSLLYLKVLALAMLTHGDKHMGNIKVDINPKALDQSLFVNLTKKTQTNQTKAIPTHRNKIKEN